MVHRRPDDRSMLRQGILRQAKDGTGLFEPLPSRQAGEVSSCDGRRVVTACPLEEGQSCPIIYFLPTLSLGPLMVLYFLAKSMFSTCADSFSIPIPCDDLITSPQIINWRYEKMHKPGKRDQGQNKEG